jgi:hypothetical protein
VTSHPRYPINSPSARAGTAIHGLGRNFTVVGLEAVPAYRDRRCATHRPVRAPVESESGVPARPAAARPDESRWSRRGRQQPPFQQPKPIGSVQATTNQPRREREWPTWAPILDRASAGHTRPAPAR